MAGKTFQEIYCWQQVVGDLKIFLASTEKGGKKIWLSLQKIENPLDFFTQRLPEKKVILDRRANLPLIRAVSLCLENRRIKSFPLLDSFFTPFQTRVYNTISQIPFGKTRQYGEVALMAGSPGGARAVGQAMKRNPFPIIFP
ncbi:methylated-DNA--[protein]-cysteine S-methyltransferase [Thermodesulfobacteriota bacterium]